MTAMTMEFDGVRELSLDEIDAVAGGDACEAAAVTGAFGSAGTGVLVGAAIGGPIGAAIGGVIGLGLGIGGAIAMDEFVCDD